MTGSFTDFPQKAVPIDRQPLLRARDLVKQGLPTMVLSRLVAAGKLERVVRGVVIGNSPTFLRPQAIRCKGERSGLPIFPSSLRGLYTLSKGSIFFGQAHTSSEGLSTFSPCRMAKA
ncbi:type IV toxin-antitoxin system AbiEi family antitoxin domain-containing protein [Burkholderia mayonis]|uniref:type IV toxin-antitoxin system AbiEi family antitoxin domain-containing protein n=1 Tax=Burkholderia mayonis TaxID=1385591 RepID=UPI0009EA69F4